MMRKAESPNPVMHSDGRFAPAGDYHVGRKLSEFESLRIVDSGARISCHLREPLSQTGFPYCSMGLDDV